jgi:hypothetical protein
MRSFGMLRKASRPASTLSTGAPYAVIPFYSFRCLLFVVRCCFCCFSSSCSCCCFCVTSAQIYTSCTPRGRSGFRRACAVDRPDNGEGEEGRHKLHGGRAWVLTALRRGEAVAVENRF